MSNRPSLKPVLKQFVKISLKSIHFYSENHEWVIDQIVSSAYKEFVNNQELNTDGASLFLYVCEEYCRLLRKRSKSTRTTAIPTELKLPPVQLNDLFDVFRYLEVSKTPRKQIGKLYYFENMGPKEISETLDVNINTVKYHIKNLKRSCLRP